MRESMSIFLEMLFLNHVDCHLMRGAEIWHNVAHESSTYSCLWQQLDLPLMVSRYIIVTTMSTHYTAILC
jgi:hypothetical protein